MQSANGFVSGISASGPRVYLPEAGWPRSRRENTTGSLERSPFLRSQHLNMIRRDYPPCKRILPDRFGTFRPMDFGAVDAPTWTAQFRPRPALIVRARKDEIVPFAHTEMIPDKGGFTLWDISEGEQRLQTIDRPALYERIKQTLLKS